MPTFNHDVNNPTDDSLIPSYPASARAHRSTVRSVLDVEHDADEGRHTFGVGDSSTRDAITEWSSGSIFILLDATTSTYVVQFYDGSAWVDTGPPADIPRLDQRSLFSVCQFSDYEVITPSAGTGPGGADEATIDASTQAAKTLSITNDIVLLNPVNVLSGKSTTIQLEVVMATGGNTITFGTDYVSSNGFAPSYSTDAGSRSLFYLTMLADGKIFVSGVAGIAAIA